MVACLCGPHPGSDMPDGVSRRQIWGMVALGGIGFTVSLFIAQLAYDELGAINTAKVGIFAGSLISALLGAGLLLRRWDSY